MEAFIQAERVFLRLSVLVFVFKGQRPVEALSRTQRNAVVTALSSKMSVLAGGPGMGKTSILKTILSILDAEGVKIRLCALSRNAADRLAEAMGRVAIGVPSLLEFNGANGTFRRNADHPVDCDLILVYESSLWTSCLHTGCSRPCLLTRRSLRGGRRFACVLRPQELLFGPH